MAQHKREIAYRVEGRKGFKGDYIDWRPLEARTLKAARREFADWLRMWTPEGRSMFRLVRTTTTTSVWDVVDA